MSIGVKSIYQLITANILIVLIGILKFNTLPPEIPLFYSKPPGDEQLTGTWFILILPFFMNFFFILNNFIYKRYFMPDEFVHKVIYFVNLFLIVSFTLVFAKIIFLVT